MKSAILLKSKNNCGQAAVEYVLLVAVCTLIFGTMFAAIRQSLYKVWVCEIGPRVQSAGGCSGATPQDCFATLKKQESSADIPPNCQ